MAVRWITPPSPHKNGMGHLILKLVFPLCPRFRIHYNSSAALVSYHFLLPNRASRAILVGSHLLGNIMCPLSSSESIIYAQVYSISAPVVRASTALCPLHWRSGERHSN